MILSYIFLLILIIFCIGLFYYIYIYLFSKDKDINCTPHEEWTMCLPNGNEVGKEIKFSNNIPTPATTVMLKSFRTGLGSPWCIGTRYAIRYISKKGEYGPLSDWSEEVVANKKSMPGCQSNIPVLIVKNNYGIDYTWPIVNVHRQIKNSDGKWEEQELVGSLLPIINQYIDTDNPNKNGIIPICKNC